MDVAVILRKNQYSELTFLLFDLNFKRCILHRIHEITMEVYTVNELAQVLGVSPQTVISWKEKNQIPSKAMTAEGSFIKSIIDPLIAIYKNTPPSDSQSNLYTQTMPAKKAKKKNLSKKHFSAKSRAEAMRLIFEEKRTYKQVAAEIGCSVASLQAWKKDYKPTVSEAPVQEKAVPPKATHSEPKKAVTVPQVSFDDFVRKYWNGGTRAVDVLLLPHEISQMVSRYVNEALRYGYDQFHK